VLTCQMHGWKWRLADGKCLTSVGHDLRCAPAGTGAVPEPVTAGSVAQAEHHGQHDSESLDD
jgi:UDP-MurNAc hydroxylase